MLYTELLVSWIITPQRKIKKIWLAYCIKDVDAGVHANFQSEKLHGRNCRSLSSQGVILSRKPLLYMDCDMRQKRDGTPHMVTL